MGIRKTNTSEAIRPNENNGIRDPAEDIGEPGLRIDVVELGGADEGVHRRRAHAAAVRAAEQP